MFVCVFHWVESLQIGKVDIFLGGILAHLSLNLDHPSLLTFMFHPLFDT